MPKGGDIRALLECTLPEQVKKDDRVFLLCRAWHRGRWRRWTGRLPRAGRCRPGRRRRRSFPWPICRRRWVRYPAGICCWCWIAASQARSNGRVNTAPSAPDAEEASTKSASTASSRTRRWQVITSAAYDQKALGCAARQGDRRRAAPSQSADGTPHSPFARGPVHGPGRRRRCQRCDIEGDGVITATELYGYIRDQVEPETIEEGRTVAADARFLSAKEARQGRVHLPAPAPPSQSAAAFRSTVRTRAWSRSTRTTSCSSTAAIASSRSCAPRPTHS